MKLSELKDKNIAILGFGLEGKSTLNFLLTHNINFKNLTILDINENLQASQLVHSVTGAEYLDNLDQYDIILKSAGVPINEKLLPYKDKIITQIQLFFDNYDGKVIVVTATKGKSTMATLIYQIIKDVGYNVKLAGNMGIPVFDEVDLYEKYDYVVLELSSYMLNTLNKKNYISVLGRVFPEHLDRHGNFDYYTRAKLNILKGSEYNVVNYKTIHDFNLQDRYNNLIPYGTQGKYGWSYGNFMEGNKKLFSCNDTLLLGEHNLENICGALAVVDILGISLKCVHQTIKNFRGLPHRMEIIGEYGGIKWVDDAISTTPESTIAAIKTFGKKIDTIMLGGTDRGYDFKELAEYIYSYDIRNIVFFPETGRRIKDEIEKYKLYGKMIKKMKLLSTNDMQEAVKFARENTKKGGICLLSTASPSYSNWKNFEEKGDLFKKYVKEIEN